MTRMPALRCLLAAFAALLFLVADAPGEPQLVRAAGMVVNTLLYDDGADGLCSLREAVANSNNNNQTYLDCPAGSGHDTITFSVSGSILISKNAPGIGVSGNSGGLTIDGSGQSIVISGMQEKTIIGVDSASTLELIGLTITNGRDAHSAGGGAISNKGGLTVTNTTISSSSSTKGGGIYNSGGLHVRGSLIVGNGANDGGGIYNNGSMTVENSTVSGNSAGDTGGGILSTSTVSSFTIVNSTITGNASGLLGTTFNRGGGINAGLPGNNKVLRNTILAGNAAPTGPDCAGELTGSGPNLIQNPVGCLVAGTPPLNGTALLAPLNDNGGLTRTHALLPGSLAIDAGDDAICESPQVSARDQRGVMRPQGAHCDLGSFEVEPFASILNQGGYEGAGGGSSLVFTVILNVPPVAPVTLHVSTADDTATTSDGDYTAIPDSILTFAPGETSKTITVLVNGDTTPEPNETFFVKLSNPTGALIADGQGVGTILDDDTPGVINIDKVALPVGDPQSFSFTPSYGAPFALTDTALPHNSGPLLFGVYSVAEAVPVGWVQTSAVCSDGSPVSAINLSPGETVTCTFTNTKKGNVTLQSVMVGGTATFSYSGTPSGAVNINGGTLTELVAPGTHVTTQGTPAGWTLISVTCDDDDSGGVVASGQVTFQVAPGENVTCIVTNTKAAISVDDVSVTEGNSGTKLLTFTVTRSAGLFVHDVAVDYATQDVSASAGSDYVAANGTLTIPKTSSSGAVSVTINGDTEFEIDETLRLLLSNPKNAVLTVPFGTGTILNDDAPSNPIGGKNLAIATGSIDLNWETGTTQTAYALLQYNSSTGVPTIINLPGAATSYSDAAATNGVVYCYVLAALGPGGAFLGLSDLLCGMAGAESGTVIPQGFSLTLGQTASATMTWVAPVGGADSYLLQRIPLDGSPITNVPLAGSAITSTQAVVAAGTCFQLIAFKGAGFGTSDVLCGVPGVSTLDTQAAGKKLQSVGEAMAAVEARLRGLGEVRVEELGRP